MGDGPVGPLRPARQLCRPQGLRLHRYGPDAHAPGRTPGLPRRSLRTIRDKPMSTEIRVPTLGESVTEATIGQWFKKVGDTVAADEPIVELETDKVTIEVPAPAAGVLEAIAAEAGTTVDVGALLGAIGGSGAAAAPAGETKAQAPANNAAGPEPVQANPAPQPVTATDRAPAPAAQKLINEKGLDAGSIPGSGKQGQVLKE